MKPIKRIRTHPGEILLEEFMRPLDLSSNALAKDLHIPANRISELIRGNRGVSGDTALRLSRYFGTTPEFWLNLQASYDLRTARARTGSRIQREITPMPRTGRQR